MIDTGSTPAIGCSPTPPYETRGSYTTAKLINRQGISGTTATGCHSWVDCALLEALGNFHTAPAPVLARVSESTLVTKPHALTFIPPLCHRSYLFDVARVQQTRFSGVVEHLNLIFRSIRRRVPLPFLFLLSPLTHSDDGISCHRGRLLPFRSGYEWHLNFFRGHFGSGYWTQRIM